jgi:tRNA nucleotidyltransferase (CCA-adding enzyme)
MNLNLPDKIFFDIPFDRDLLPADSWIVGGAVRDALLGRSRQPIDLDFIVPEKAIETAQIIANNYRAGYVLLDDERKIARVVFPAATIDIASREGSSLDVDLQRRDYRMNAIAVCPDTGEIYDPLGGVEDIRFRVINAVSLDNLRDDPLRLLRAYRQGSQLGFTIAPQTLVWLREVAPEIAKVSTERVLAELRYMMITPSGGECLANAAADGILSPFLSQSQPIFADRYRSSLIELDRNFSALQSSDDRLFQELQKPLKSTIYTNNLAIARWLPLLSVEKPDIATELERLTVSTAEIQAIFATIEGISHLQNLLANPNSDSHKTQQYYLFKTAGKLFSAVILHALAKKHPYEQLQPLISRYFDPDDRLSHPTLPIDGHTLMQELNLSPSPQIGKLLQAIQLAYVEETINSREEAIAFAKQHISKSMGNS